MKQMCSCERYGSDNRSRNKVAVMDHDGNSSALHGGTVAPTARVDHRRQLGSGHSWCNLCCWADCLLHISGNIHRVPLHKSRHLIGLS